MCFKTDNDWLNDTWTRFENKLLNLLKKELRHLNYTLSRIAYSCFDINNDWLEYILELKQ